jgi:hypothetical protein
MRVTAVEIPSVAVAGDADVAPRDVDSGKSIASKTDAARRLRHRITYVLAAVLMIIMIVQFGKFLDNAAPSLVDDSAIIRALGQKNSPTLNDIWIDLKNIQELQEFAHNNTMSRFRPAYYPLRSLAIYLLGDNFRLWYLVTFLLYAATSAALFSLMMRSFGILSAALFLLLYLGHKAWSDLIPRLGPIEIECMLFATILVWLLWNWIEFGKRASFALAVPLLFFLAAMKEPNSVYLIFVGGLLLVCGLIIRHKRMAVTGPVLIVVGCVVLAVLFRWTGQTSRSGIVPLDGPLGDYLKLGGRDWTRWIVIVLAGVLIVGLIAELTGYAKRTSSRELLAMLVAVMSLEAFRILTFYISYTAGAGTNVIETRYGYPFFLVQALVVGVVIGRLLVLVDTSWARTTTIKGIAVASMLGLVLGNHGLFARQVFAATELWSNFNMDTEKTLNEAAEALLHEHQKGNSPVLFASGPGLDFEPQLALVQYLRRKLPSTIIYLDRSEPFKYRDRSEPSMYADAYGALIMRLGGTLVSPEQKSTLIKNGCIDVHVDLIAYDNPDCLTLSIVLGRPN